MVSVSDGGPRTNNVGSRLRLFGWEETGTSLGEEEDTDHPLSNFKTELMPRIVGQEVRVAQMQNAEQYQRVP